MPRYKLRTLLILLAIGPPMLAVMGCDANSSLPQHKRLQKPLVADVRKILDTAEHLVLFSIEGDGEGISESTDTKFHGFTILGRTEVTDPDERKMLLDALYKGINEADSFAACFYPRHGISATVGDETADLVICFQCLQIEVFSKEHTGAFTSSSPNEVFNAVLTRAGVPLATPPATVH